MRKVIILLILVVLVWACYETIVVGFNMGEDLAVSNYKQIDTASKQVDTLISQLINLNDKQYPNRKTKLESTIEEYKDKKEEYEELQAIAESTNSTDISLVDIYDVDFLWTIIGNYGTEEGITLRFDIARSRTSTSNSADYTICDLKFLVSGDYIAITDFIYDLEDDSRLGFEISGFKMSKGGENLQATFEVRDIPVNNENLTEFKTSIDTNTNTNTTNTNTNTVNNRTNS